jgi:HSP20 family molecular chaperone IbpA
VKHKGLRIEARDDRLEIKALRDDRETARRLSGFVPDGYEASFRLNPSLDAEKIDAELRDGVLRVIIPRAEGSKPRRIPVKSQT